MLNAQQTSLFGLSTQEKKIVNLLNKSRVGLTATKIGVLVAEPRTTVNFYLNKLSDRGWVDKIKTTKSRYPLWFLKERNEIKNSLSGFFSSVGITLPGLTTLASKEGYEQVRTAYEKIIEVGKAERVFVVQGSRAPFAALKKLPTEFIERIHVAQKQKPIILEGITSRKSLSVFEKMSLRELKSHYGRLTIVYLVPDEYMDFDTEFYIFHDNVIIIQPITEKAYIIKDEVLVKTLKMIVEFMKQYSEKIDVNSYIKKLIEKIEQ
ncbi:MAG: hypothetical protein A2589_02625 [Candidatus Vogelbacteria bacterium RIFOXYD1_FULL_46_19]|uniref:Transcription regulator TrmB N-terminal domain-containing protein n=1 Tax=Candidatus Vogelbacteria bacterium RIFOXYD1_FULL_46_19 TaxID=1802439 RepID=A0A1G2QIW9_9BACT|nr:MAG: hypothetical protein A2589_02625 [Candidatus Vogelbacteria bacterium RIFOXYD1_FULL_46_19]